MALSKGASQSRQDRGKYTEPAVARWLRGHGWPDARPWNVEDGPRARDIYGIDGQAIEIKARTDFKPIEWWKQAKRNSDAGERPCVIMRMNRQGDAEDSPDDYLVFRRLADDELAKGEVDHYVTSDGSVYFPSQITIVRL
jgi:hypothetical protein